MEIFLFLMIMMVISTVEATFVDTYKWVSIDCGAETTTLDTTNMINWETDTAYIKSGINMNVSIVSPSQHIMNTLRSFPNNDDTNCYQIAVDDDITKYLVRASFYYGNYDRLSKPPTFDVLVNGLHWTTVVTSLDLDPIVIEGTFFLGSYILQVCLARLASGGGGTPFISSLEVTPWPFNTYRKIDLHYAFLLQSRVAFGATRDIRYNGNFTGDELNRIWKATGLQDYQTVTNSSSYPIGYIENIPPYSALVNAVTASSLSDPIVIPLNLTGITDPLCAMLYFTELNGSRQPSDTRKFQVDALGQVNLSMVDLGIYLPQTVTLSLNSTEDLTNITISAVKGSTLPPILNAMEVFTVKKSITPYSPPSQSFGNVCSPVSVLLFVCSIFIMVL